MKDLCLGVQLPTSINNGIDCRIANMVDEVSRLGAVPLWRLPAQRVDSSGAWSIKKPLWKSILDETYLSFSFRSSYTLPTYGLAL